MTPLFTHDVLDVMLAGLRQHDPTATLDFTNTCHPKAGMDAVYTGEGILTLLCHSCQREKARFSFLAATIPTTGTQEPLS